MRASWRPTRGNGPWELGAQAAWGREYAVPDGDKPAYEVSLRATYEVDAATWVGLRAQRFSSRTSTSNGFARTTLALMLERSW